ncbi:MAG: hypothetical protein EOL97_15695 [Spirochaetia bacterium]|nr:hypothetical protein [Spirochaetia bacterium]
MINYLEVDCAESRAGNLNFHILIRNNEPEIRLGYQDDEFGRADYFFMVNNKRWYIKKETYEQMQRFIY